MEVDISKKVNYFIKYGVLGLVVLAVLCSGAVWFFYHHQTGFTVRDAQVSSSMIGARTKAALGAKKARGERTGSVPYGYTLVADGVHLEAVPEEQEVIAEARRLHGAGQSLRAIARELERRGFVSRAGKAFLAEQVKRLLAA